MMIASVQIVDMLSAVSQVREYVHMHVYLCTLCLNAMALQEAILNLE